MSEIINITAPDKKINAMCVALINNYWKMQGREAKAKLDKYGRITSSIEATWQEAVYR